MLLANNGIIPPKEWMHNNNIRNFEGKTIKFILYNRGYIYKNDVFIPNCKI